MNRFHIRVPSKQDWSRFHDSKIQGGGIFCPTSEPPSVGAQVSVEITFVGGPRFIISGVVLWRRTQLKDPRLRPGVGIQVLPADRGKLEFVTAWTRGGMVNKRGDRRLPVRLPVSYTVNRGRRINFTRDVSRSGIFIRARQLLEAGTPIQLTLASIDAQSPPLPLRGQVARSVESSDDQGMGVELIFGSTEERASYERFVEELAERYLSGDLPDDVVG